MKTIYRFGFAMLCLLFPYVASGQSSFGFRTYESSAGIDASVYDAQGARIAASNYLGEIWGGISSNALSPLIYLNGNTRYIQPFRDDGYIIAGSALLAVPDVSPGGWAWLQMRAWDARLGGTYEEVVARGLGGYGESDLFYARGGHPDVIPPTSPGLLIGLQSFSLRAVVPEPSAWALLGLGGIGLWWTSRRRHKQP